MPVHILIIVIAVLEVMNDVVVNYLVVHYLWMMIYTFMQMSRVMVVVNNFVSMLSVTSLILVIMIMLVFTFFLTESVVLGMPMLVFMFILFVLIALIKVMYYLVVHHLGIRGSVQLVVV